MAESLAAFLDRKAHYPAQNPARSAGVDGRCGEVMGLIVTCNYGDINQWILTSIEAILLDKKPSGNGYINM